MMTTDEKTEGSSDDKPGSQEPPEPSVFPRFRYPVLVISLVAFLCHLLAVPPLNWFPLAFIVPLFWVPLYRFPAQKGFYRQAWLAALFFWLIVTRWVGFPHPATMLGWLALSAYLACYFPLYLAAVRRLIHWHIPALAAVLVPFLAVEFLKKHLFGGFSFAALEHAFYRQPILIQIADLPGGEYLVALVVLLVGTALGLIVEEMVATHPTRHGRTFALICIIGTTLAATLAYGYVQLNHWSKSSTSGQTLRVALLQDPTTFRFPVSNDLNLTIHKSYLKLAEDAARDSIQANQPLDLIVWPEGCFADTYYDLTPNGHFPPSTGMTPDECLEQSRQAITRQNDDFLALKERLGAPLVLGLGSVIYDAHGQVQFHNSALWIGEGPFRRYDKIHLVMFGEYLPLANWLPDWFPLKTLCVSVDPGKEPVVFPVGPEGKYRLSVNICFESSSSRFIRNQIEQLKARGEDPDLLLNISNDGWFRHCAQVDFHLATCVFRAVENRKTMLSATHGGLSAWIDPAGRIRKELHRNDTTFLLATPTVPQH